MKSSTPFRLTLLATGTLLVGLTGLLAQGPAAPNTATPAAAPATAPGAAAAPAAGGGGFGRGGVPGTPGLALPPIDLYNAVNRNPVLNDTELTLITRLDEDLEKQIAAVKAARAAVDKSSLTLPVNGPDLAAKVQVLGNAETALAIAKAAGFARLKTDLKATTPQKIDAIKLALTNPISNGTVGGGRGGGAAAPAAAAPGAPAQAAPAPAAGAARGGG